METEDGKVRRSHAGEEAYLSLDLGSTKTSSALSVQEVGGSMYGLGTASKKTSSMVLQEVVIELLAAIATDNKY